MAIEKQASTSAGAKQSATKVIRSSPSQKSGATAEADSSPKTTEGASTTNPIEKPAATAGVEPKKSARVEPAQNAEENEGWALGSKLVKEAKDVVGRRKRLEALIDKAEKSKSKVKEKVYSRVLDDYHQKLGAIATEFTPLRDRILQELTRIRGLEVDLRARLGAIQDELEELRFRCEIGEFGKARLEEGEHEKVATSQRLEGQLSTIEETYATARELVGDDVEMAFSQAAGAKAGVPKAPGSKASKAAVGKSSMGQGPTRPLATGAPPPPPPAKARPVDSKSGTAPVERAFLKRTRPKEGKPFLLSHGETVIGRSAMSDLRVEGPTVSRRHAIVTFSDGSYVIEDTSSGGGVLINGKKAKRRKLRVGDTITVGTGVFEFQS